MIFCSSSIQTPSALRALRLVTRLAVVDISVASYELFKVIVASEDLTDQHWEAARLAVCGAFRGEGTAATDPPLGELGEILRFLDYHLGLQWAGEDHESAIRAAMYAVVAKSNNFQADPLTSEHITKLNRGSPSFANRVRSMMHPNYTFRLRLSTTGLIAVTSDQWFHSPTPAKEMSEFCEHLAVFVIDFALHGEYVQRCGVIILFEMLRSPEWREHIAPRFWSMLAYSAQFPGGRESFWWCLENAIELLEFVRGSDSEGLRWWYGTLWFHHDKLDTTVRDEVERVARDMSLGDGLSDLNLYLNLIGQEVTRTRREVDELPNENRPAGFGMGLRARLIALEGNYDKLARITGGRPSANLPIAFSLF